jgi:hypothetical protein
MIGLYISKNRYIRYFLLQILSLFFDNFYNYPYSSIIVFSYNRSSSYLINLIILSTFFYSAYFSAKKSTNHISELYDISYKPDK